MDIQKIQQYKTAYNQVDNYFLLLIDIALQVLLFGHIKRKTKANA